MPTQMYHNRMPIRSEAMPLPITITTLFACCLTTNLDDAQNWPHIKTPG